MKFKLQSTNVARMIEEVQLLNNLQCSPIWCGSGIRQRSNSCLSHDVFIGCVTIESFGRPRKIQNKSGVGALTAFCSVSLATDCWSGLRSPWCPTTPKLKRKASRHHCSLSTRSNAPRAFLHWSVFEKRILWDCMCLYLTVVGSNKCHHHQSQKMAFNSNSKVKLSILKHMIT